MKYSFSFCHDIDIWEYVLDLLLNIMCYCICEATDYCHTTEKHRWIDSFATFNYSPTLTFNFLHICFWLSVNTYRFFAQSTKAFPALHTGDLELIAVIDEAIGALWKWEASKRDARDANMKTTRIMHLFSDHCKMHLNETVRKAVSLTWLHHRNFGSLMRACSVSFLWKRLYTSGSRQSLSWSVTHKMDSYITVSSLKPSYNAALLRLSIARSILIYFFSLTVPVCPEWRSSCWGAQGRWCQALCRQDTPCLWCACPSPLWWNAAWNIHSTQSTGMMSKTASKKDTPKNSPDLM